MHVFATWAYGIFAACLLVGLIVGLWDYARAWDIKFNQATAEQYGRRIDWMAARKQQLAVPLLGFPLGLAVLALMVTHYWVSFDGRTYTIISIGWFLSAPVRRLWQTAVGIRVERHLKCHGFRAAESYQYSALRAVREYYRRGMERRPWSGRQDRRVFIGRLRLLNHVSWLWRWPLHLRVLLPVLAEAIASLVWPFTAMFMVFHHTSAAADGVTLVPWWAKN